MRVRYRPIVVSYWDNMPIVVSYSNPELAEAARVHFGQVERKSRAVTSAVFGVAGQARRGSSEVSGGEGGEGGWNGEGRGKRC